MDRTHSRQVMAAWLHGYETGHADGRTDGRVAWFAEGYDVGHADGVSVGRRLADDEAAARWRAYRAMSDAVRPNLARPRPWGEAKPLPTPADCLATWPATPALSCVRDAA
ncbi:hypothetical protein [Promicromonospora sp. NFX87]|uniref:hypothetical protein n=1 Tax=Promicromonospora sp. NFX87 TaxID=3402691 RepID=UPI003AFADAB2